MWQTIARNEQKCAARGHSNEPRQRPLSTLGKGAAGASGVPCKVTTSGVATQLERHLLSVSVTTSSTATLEIKDTKGAAYYPQRYPLLRVSH